MYPDRAHMYRPEKCIWFLPVTKNCNVTTELWVVVESPTKSITYGSALTMTVFWTIQSDGPRPKIEVELLVQALTWVINVSTYKQKLIMCPYQTFSQLPVDNII